MLEVAGTSSLAQYNTGSRVFVGSSATLALAVGGTSGWSATNINGLLTSNGTGFAVGSTLGIDTTNATSGFSYSNTIGGSMGLTILGPNTLTLSQSNSFSGPTTVTGGTLALSNSGALQGSTLIAPTVGSVSFIGTGTSFTFGGLSGAGNITLTHTAVSDIALTVGATMRAQVTAAR